MQIKNQAKTTIKKIKVQKPSTTTPIKPIDQDAEIISFVNRNHQAAVDYRKNFKDKWDNIISQIRCVHPAAWAEKEDWQSKVFIPQQSKKVETAVSYLDKMLFGQKRFYAISGVEKKDKELTGYLMDYFDVLLDRGNFYLENDFVMQEASQIGSAFLKVLVKPDRSGVDLIWRSAYNISFDPGCGYNFQNAKYVCDEYKRTLNELIDDLSKPNPLYRRESVQKIIDMAEQESKGKSDKDTVSIKSIDGTSQVTISKDWFDLNIVEYWGMAKESFEDKDKIKSYRMVNKIITVVNNKIKIREDDNPYGFIPIFICRVKPRGYDTYGLGFCENTVDLQDLTNSMINLGFDSLKMCSMDIAIIDGNKIKDPASIEYKPMATWMVKGDPRAAVSLTRQGISALGEIMRGLTILDQFDQEASGVPKQAGQASELAGNGSNTLGEYQAKLSMIDNRFLKIGRFIERDYIEPLLKGIFKILFNPLFFNQVLIDRIIGMKEVETVIPDPISGMQIPIKQNISKINFDEIVSAGDMAFDFKALGMTQFSKSMETLQKLKELLQAVMNSPQLMVITKVEEVFKRVLQAAEIGDYQEFLKSEEEIKKIMNQMQPQPMPMGGQ